MNQKKALIGLWTVLAAAGAAQVISNPAPCAAETVTPETLLEEMVSLLWMSGFSTGDLYWTIGSNTSRLPI